MSIWISESIELIDLIANYASSTPWIYILGVGVAVVISRLTKEMISL